MQWVAVVETGGGLDVRSQTRSEAGETFGPVIKPWDLADKVRLRLFGKIWIAARFPGFWYWLREGVRRGRCCELSECWNEPTCTWHEYRVCSEHYPEIAKTAAADQHAMKEAAVVASAFHPFAISRLGTLATQSGH
jgi:hypothetical protein